MKSPHRATVYVILETLLAQEQEIPQSRYYAAYTVRNMHMNGQLNSSEVVYLIHVINTMALTLPRNGSVHADLLDEVGLTDLAILAREDEEAFAKMATDGCYSLSRDVRAHRIISPLFIQVEAAHPTAWSVYVTPSKQEVPA